MTSKSARTTDDYYAYDAVQTVDSAPMKLFDVTCIVGSVYHGGNVSPTVAAFQLIAEQGGLGMFTFPTEDGDTMVVTVDRRPTEK